MDSIFLTGATGCTGMGVLKYLLSRGYNEIYALVRKEPENPLPKIKYIVGDLTDKQRLNEIFSEIHVDHIWHLAAAVHRSVKRNEFFTINAGGTRNLLEAAINNGVKTFSYTSTTGVYGRIKDSPTTEEHRVKPWGIYSKSKYEAEQIISAMCKEKGIEGNILRLPMILGKGDRHVYPVIGKFIKRNLLPILGRPNHKISIVHPYDVGKALETVTNSNSKNCDIYHTVSCNVTWRELIREIEKNLVGKSRLKFYLPYPIFFLAVWAFEAISRAFFPKKEPHVNREYAQMVGREWVFDITKLEKLGYKPMMEREAIIKDTIYPEDVPIPLKASI
ncbi:MAG: NAD(P)-dependent oxidoreductase [Candidatus Heimdallarchaeota archaeon]|nr:NAD(P)-dependent oxidoreductase [Candidatus Heimdallarchaeota archaeon]MCK4878009.1 NAD(P)-dependent oxidoreductase [Candidatus Heimdallarchaeota archaeon]